MVGKTVSHYQILEEVGEGGMGIVYRARDVSLDRIVAMKFLPKRLTPDNQERDRFLQEARAASALNHPAITTIYEIGEAAGEMFIAMEYCDGTTLRGALDDGRLTVATALDIAVHVGEGLAAAHQKGIVHRDIKPDNIMLAPAGMVKILDFGLAKLRGAANLTKVGSTLGTAGYMSPEQAQGLGVDARSDIFSFGTVLYEMIAGQNPFRADHEAAMIYSIVNESPRPLTQVRSEIPVELDRVVQRALAKEPDARYQRVDDIVSDLRRIQHHMSDTIPVAGKSPGIEAATRTTKKASGRRATFLMVSAGVLVLAGVAVLSYFLASGSKEQVRSIAVMPFANVGRDSSNEYLVDGFSESLINALSRLPGLKLMSWSSVFRFKGKDVDPRNAGRELGVDALLTGRILQKGSDVSISAELVNARDDTHLWGDHYDRPLTELAMLESELSQEISKQLNITLTGSQEKQITSPITNNSEAYQLYLKGRFYLNKRTKDAFEKALDCFQQAIARDSSYAYAYAGLADAYALEGWNYLQSPMQSYDRARAAARKAIELDGSLGEARVTLAGLTETILWDWPDVEEQYRKALALSPNYASGHHWYGEFLAAMGRSNEAIAELQKAQELDPLAPILYCSLAHVYATIGRFDTSIAEAKKALDLDAEYPRAHGILGIAYLEKGRHPEAVREIQKAIVYSDSTLEYVALLGWAYGMTGERSKAGAIAQYLENRSNRQYVSPAMVAIAFGGMGQADRGYQWLNRAIENHDPALEYLKVEPWFDWARRDPRFAALVKRVGLSG